MKRIFILLTLLAVMPFASINAQDARNRVASTIVADALAQLPAETPAKYNEVLAELVGTGAEGIEMVATMLQPAKEGVRNSAIEYAIYGAAAYVTKDTAMRGAVRQGLKNAFAKISDKPNKAFIMTALEVCATAEDAEWFAAQLGDEYLGNFAARTLATMKGSEKVVLNLMKADKAPRIHLAHIASYKQIPEAENILIHWLAEGADDALKCQIYNALVSCGSSQSVKILEKASAASDHAFDTSDAYGAYVQLLNKLAKSEPKVAEKGAKKLMKDNRTNVFLAGLDLMVQLHSKEATPLVIKALAGPDSEYRYGALRAAEAFADNSTYAAVAGAYEKASQGAKVDILNWFGANHVAQQIDLVATATKNANDDIACAAIAAASRIGGNKALEALVAKMDNENSEAVNKALVAGLLTFNGKINDEFIAAIGDKNKSIATTILAKRRMPAAVEKVLPWAKAGDKAAIAALNNIAAEKDFNTLCDMLEAGQDVTPGIIKSISEKPAAEQVKMVQDRIAKSSKKHLYYPVLAATGANEAVAPIMEGYKAGNVENMAFQSMMSMNNDALIRPLMDVAKSDAQRKDQALSRYIQLTTNSKKLTPEQKYMNFRNALETKPSVKVQNSALKALSATQTYPAMMLASTYMDNAETAQAAANTVLEIATKHPEFYSAEVKALLEKVSTTLNDGDAVYKRKDIEKFISENKARESHSIIMELSEEEKKEGFEMLFDGQNMDKWEGNLTAYEPIDGAMNVNAAYGSAGNLYTKKDYKDFILRFEFCFVRPGINNGVGIRTIMGKDAAYHGMEIQILDHDDPIYKNLRPYQVHGSVYGIIPAKRIVSPELGTWNQEEIRIKGDNIKVTVNGEVIVDGNIRKACKGHNVAPDGSSRNPYTVDHLNHPGLFNEKGRIGFLGHGNGLKIRNVRVKEL
ncbi:MAG: DUF1080 domain-containing protein [Alistipes sp.]|nr:DUF1080 domain-containing protein [Alistipes sp.]